MRRVSIRYIAEGLVAAVVLVSLATLARMFLTAVFSQSLPFATFFPAILLATLYRDLVAGIAATALSLAVTWNYEIGSVLGFHGDVGTGSKIAFSIAGGALVWFATLYRRKVTALQQADRERQLLLNELEHRSKNKLAVVQAILALTVSNRDEANIAAERIRAAIDTEKLLGEHKETTLDMILRAPFWAYGAERIQLNGPRVNVPAHIARSLSMVFHELTTNAVKHGALKEPGGRVEAEWSCAQDEVKLVWRERGGPKVVEPAQHNFGTHLLTKTVSLLRGTIDAQFESAGFRCTITFRNR